MKLYTLVQTSAYPSEYNVSIWPTLESAQNALKQERDECLECYEDCDVLEDSPNVFYLQSNDSDVLVHLEIQEQEIQKP